MRTKPVDNLWTTRQSSAQVVHILASNLTHRLASILAGEPLKRIARRRCLVLVGLLCIVGTTPAEATTRTDHLKLYAHSRIIDDKQYKCFVSIINKENRSWDVNAKNGSHFGIGQMRSKHYRNLDAYRQIDATILYIKGRYGSICKAWEFHKAKGYY